MQQSRAAQLQFYILKNTSFKVKLITIIQLVFLFQNFLSFVNWIELLMTDLFTVSETST